ncbi:MAG TPA: alpha/beta fold hydrolase [Solirubrobacter sp.]|nr:alpha/beta fold hydrolase [Solirubrobacter sp.]
MNPAVAPEVHAVPTSDGTEVRLTRYRYGGKGPLILAPGYGNAARAFTVDTVAKNWVGYLGEHGWDVWLFDYRASPDLPSAVTQFTVDDIALRDWPAAVDTVRRESGADSVQALGHCIGGLTLFMALGGGMEGVRSATFSALAGHPVPTPGNRLRAWVRVPTIMKALGIKTFTSDYDPRSWNGRIVEALMRIAPFKHVYDSPVARRIYFMYGDVYRFENIDAETMETAVPSFFGASNMTFFEHMGVMVRAGRALDARGRDRYLSNLDAFRMPIEFVTGEHNRMFMPESVRRTHEMLRRAHGPGDYSQHVFHDYGHLDLWLGEHAERDVWPTVLAGLERHG